MPRTSLLGMTAPETTLTAEQKVQAAETLWVDYSFSRPPPAQIKAVGYEGAIRYLAYLPNPKVILKPEYDALHAAGLDVRLVWEQGAQDMLQGASAGAAHSAAANAQADQLGYSMSLPIYYAADFDATPDTWPAIQAYLEACTGRPAGVYGPAGMADAMLQRLAAKYGWQAGASTAWYDNNRVSELCHWYQRATPTLPNPGGSIDENVLLRSDTTAPPPVPTPEPTPPPVVHPPPPAPAPVPPAHRNIYTPLVPDGIYGPQSIKAEQFVSFGGNTTQCDGIFGPASRVSMQQHLHVTPDGIIGPVTVEALQHHVGATPDGIWGPQTTLELQRALNAGTY